MIMLVTINTDAGWCPIFKIGTWAFWIAHNNGRMIRSGILKERATDSTHSELLAILNALHQLYLSDVPALKKIIINCDNNGWLVYASKRPELQQHLDSIKDKLFQKYLPGKKWFEYRHVKGHSSKKDARSYVNKFLDKQCKELLIKARADIKRKTINSAL